MRTFELLIVFGALMALIALVGIGLDWIGKPLRGRRFIPRMYRYDDEKLPGALIGPTLGPITHSPPPTIGSAPPSGARTGMRPVQRRARRAARPTTRVEQVSHPAAPGGLGAFTASLAATGASSDLAASAEPSRKDNTHKGAGPPGGPWAPGMALDSRVGDRKPAMADKAKRFWLTSAESLGDSHFGDENRGRMHEGKPPQRRNPRTGRVETMQLVGLRQASNADDVRMRWADDSIDPWSAQ